MSLLKNRVQLIGYAGTNPEIKHFEGNKNMAKLSLATLEVYKNAKGEKVNETQWHQLIAFGKVAKIFEKYISKGKEIAIQGRLVYRSYEDKNGDKKYITEIEVKEVLLLGN